MTRQERFLGATVLITGGASGIGAVTAARFADEGAQVVIADVDDALGHATAEQVPRSRFLHLDVTDQEAVTSQVGALGRVDVLVNNAMVAADADFGDLTLEHWLREVGVILTGGFLMTQAVLPGMIAGGGGAIVNISSVNAVTALGNEAYSAGKAGLLSMTRSIAVRYGPHGIRCNAVLPGTVRTPVWDRRLAAKPDLIDRVSRWYPMGRVGTCDDIASAILFLAGPEASWITGVSLPVDGGLLAGNPRIADEIITPDAPGQP